MTQTAAHQPAQAAGTIGATIPAWLLRAALGVACLATVVTIEAWASPSTMWSVAQVLFGVAAVVRPASHAATGFLGLVALTVLITDPGVSWWIAPAVLGVHATHSLAALAAVLPWDTDVEAAALRPSSRRFVVVQLASQAVVLLALLTVS
jgi:hypothetical protein